MLDFNMPCFPSVKFKTKFDTRLALAIKTIMKLKSYTVCDRKHEITTKPRLVLTYERNEPGLDILDYITYRTFTSMFLIC